MIAGREGTPPAETPNGSSMRNERAEHRHATRSAARLTALLAPLAVWAALCPIYLADGNGLSPDSASYIDCARSIVAGRGFEVRPFGGLDSPLRQPLDAFPPGYSLLTAGLVRLGVGDAYEAARAVTVGCSGLFLLLALAFYARTLPPWSAALAGLALAATPAMLIYETACLSDGPYTLLAAASLLLLLKATPASEADGPTSRRPRVGWLAFAAGLVGGFAWCVRNVGVALFVASLAYFVMQMPRLRLAVAIRATVPWLLGWLLGGGWLLAWNVHRFGAMSPYRMPPGRLTAQGAAVITAASVVAVVSAALLLRRRLAPLWRARPAVALLGAFLLFHTFAIIMAHCVYRMGEAVQSPRFYVPVYWIALWFLASGLGGLRRDSCSPRRAGERRRCRTAAAMIALAMAVFAASAGFRGRQDQPDRDELTRLGQRIPKDKLVLADRVEELRVFADANARQTPDVAFGQAPLTWSQMDQAAQDGRLWGIALWDRDLSAEGRFGDALRDLVLNPGRFPQWRKTEIGGRMTAWEYAP
ncbi:MAG: hypothetical protein ABFC96_07960 [Thermoguttaceae bacterium]